MASQSEDSRSMRLRRATGDDVPAVAEFQTECWREAYAGLVPDEYLQRVGSEEREARWGDRIRRGLRSVVIAEDQGTIHGVVSWAAAPDDDGSEADRELASLYVAAPAQGTGLAARLLDEAVGSGPALLWVFEANARAIGFYAKHGFAADGSREVDADTGLWQIRMCRR